MSLDKKLSLNEDKITEFYRGASLESAIIEECKKSGGEVGWEYLHSPDPAMAFFMEPAYMSKIKLPKQGFKLHIYCEKNEKTAKKILSVLLPYLIKERVAFKVTKKLSEMDGTQEGKFITIYPKEARDAWNIAYWVDSILSKHGLVKRANGGVPCEKLIPDSKSKRVYYRFGGFTSDYINVRGKMIKDDRSKPIPDGVKDFFEVIYQKIKEPKTVDELLYALRGTLGKSMFVYGSSKYSGEEIARVIEEYKETRDIDKLKKITKTFGLRKKVYELVH